MTKSINKSVLKRIYGKKRGWVFTPNHFIDIGSKKTVSNLIEL